MKNSDIIIRIKKSNPYYELYSIGPNEKTIFFSSCNDISKIKMNFKRCFVFLSSSFCVYGVRSVKGMKKIKKYDNKFYFNHKTISSENDLKFSNTILQNGVLKQSWTSKVDYKQLVVPLIEKIGFRISFLGPEISFFAGSGLSEIIVGDGKIFSKILPDNSVEVIANNENLVKGEEYNNSAFNDSFFKKKLSIKYPYFLKRQSNNYLIISSIILFITLLLHIIIFALLSNPVNKAQINYLISSAGFEKIHDPFLMINTEKSIQNRFTEKVSNNLTQLSNRVGELNNELLNNIIELNYFDNKELSIKFQNYLSPVVFDYIQSQKNLAKISVDDINGEVEVKWNYE